MEKKKLFLIDTSIKAKQRGRLFCFEDIRDKIPLAVQAVAEDFCSFRQDCIDLRDTYGLRQWDILFDQVSFMGKSFHTAVVSTQAMITALTRKKRANCERIRMELCKADPDMWLVQHLAWQNTSFYFAWEGRPLAPEMALLTYLRGLKDPEFLVTHTVVLLQQELCA